MKDVSNLLLLGISIFANYRRAKSKNARVLTGVLFAVFLNILGVGIFYFKTRTRPQKSQTNSMNSTNSIATNNLMSYASIQILGGDTRKKIKAIKLVRVHTGMGLKEAKDLIESMPCVIPRKYPLAAAQNIIKDLQKCGFHAEIIDK
jgi:ribosomal protein L7/L12